jgi:hypothetical protein
MRSCKVTSKEWKPALSSVSTYETYVDGLMASTFFCAERFGRLRSYVRPGGAAHMSAGPRGCVKTQMRDRRMVGRLAVFDCRISTDVLRSMSF